MEGRINRMPRLNDLPPPFFILGSPRSGTTLLSRILDRHSRIAVYHESHYYPIFRSIRHLYGDLNHPSNLVRFVEDVREVTRVQGFMEPPSTQEIIDALDDASFEAVLTAFLRLYARRLGKFRCGEKTPEHHRYLSEILEKFPATQVIFLLRDPRDTVLSIRKALGASLPGAVRMWRAAFDSYQRFSNRVHLVRYEELVGAPGKVCQELCALLGEPFESELLRYYESIPSSLAARPNFSKLLHHVDAASVGNFRQMSPRDIHWIEAACAEGMEALGYRFTAAKPKPLRLSAPSKLGLVVDRLRYYGLDRRRWRRGWMRWKILLRLQMRRIFSFTPLSPNP